MPGVAEVTYQLYIYEDVFFNVNDLGSERDREKSEIIRLIPILIVIKNTFHNVDLYSSQFRNIHQHGNL